jgi:hypothetical protein
MRLRTQPTPYKVQCKWIRVSAKRSQNLKEGLLLLTTACSTVLSNIRSYIPQILHLYEHLSFFPYVHVSQLLFFTADEINRVHMVLPFFHTTWVFLPLTPNSSCVPLFRLRDQNILLCHISALLDTYKGTDKYLVRPVRKQATATEDFDVHISYLLRAWGSVVVQVLRYKSEGPRIDPRSCHWEFFPRYPTSPRARGRLSLSKWVPGYSWG